ncbi:MAG: hypothetical protein ACMG6H_07930 [Acidobacteriota bacterium]
MSKSDQKTYRANISQLLKEAQISIRESAETQGGVLHQLEPAHCGGRRALVFDGKEKGVTIAIRVELPDASSLRNQPVTSPEVLQLLGALTQALQGHDAEARLVGGDRGLEAVMVSKRLCESSLDAERISERLNDMQDVVKEIEPALLLSGQTLIATIIARVGPVIADLSKEESTEEAVIVPSFNEEARDRMMSQT